MSPGARRVIAAGEVHLWIVRLEASDARFDHALTLLSPDETARANRFYFDRHRRAFALGRAALRTLLGQYIPVAPAGVSFTYGQQGKPSLVDTSCSLRFNVSNSGNLAAYAFTTGCEIGVDIEQHRAVHDFENIAHRFFSAEETADLMALPPGQRTDAFFRCWSRKEAYIKAMGGGLAIPLDSFRVTLRPGDAPRMISIDGSEEAACQWTFHSFDPGPEIAGAIAYCDQPRTLREEPLVSAEELLDPSALN